MRKFFSHGRPDERGAAMVEYAMLIGLISLVCLAATTTLGTEISSVFSDMASLLASI
jgi:pilus assembly protein Flp/PilA